jgi:hypothetical protein
MVHSSSTQCTSAIWARLASGRNADGVEMQCFFYKDVLFLMHLGITKQRKVLNEAWNRFYRLSDAERVEKRAIADKETDVLSCCLQTRLTGPLSGDG